LSADGSTFVYSTYLGGSDGNESGTGIAVDAAGNAYVTGFGASTDFPTTPGAFLTTGGGF
jgi:Beta-propeller repeat